MTRVGVRPRFSAVVLAAFLALGLSSGCGYRTDQLFRADVKSVYVDMFESKEFRRDMEFMLTEAVKKKIATDSPYRLAPRDKADTILRGEILEVRQAAFAPDELSRLPRDKEMTLAIRLEWKDLRSGAMLVNQPVLLQSLDYLPPGGESEAFAQDKVIEKMAARVVSKLYADW